MCHYANLLRATLTISLMLVAMAGTAVAGPFDDATAAYQRGDYATAMLIFKPLADRGDAVAQYRVGLMYFHGEGASQDYGEAVKWFRKAVELGNADAMYNLGMCYLSGEGVAKDHAEAVKWFRWASGRGSVEATAALKSLGKE